jgi:hypothetical protein
LNFKTGNNKLYPQHYGETSLIQLVVGWVRDLFNSSSVELVETSTPNKNVYYADFQPVETVTPSQMGYRFEHNELKRLMERLKRFETVDFTDVEGVIMTSESIDKRFGRDGGIDCVIHIVTRTERGAANVATRIRNIMVTGDY